MNNNEQIRFAGDISIETIKIITANGFGQEITNQVVALEVYEDLYSPFISGIIAVKETLDFINLFPFVGEEYIEINVYTPSFTERNMTINDQFIIHKVTNRAQAGDRSVVYELHFMSREALVDLNKRPSMAFEGKISDIARSMLTNKEHGLETTKNVVIEETMNGTKYVSNFWSPIKNLNFLSQKALNLNNTPSYLFFENRNGFNFQSLENMYNSDVQQEFIYDGYDRDTTIAGETKRNIEEDYKRIIDIEIPVYYDLIEKTKMGMYSSKKTSHDIVTKRYSIKIFDILEQHPEKSHLNEFPAISNKSIRRGDQLHMMSEQHYGSFNGYKYISSGTTQERRSLLKQAETTKINITVPGRTDYTVGAKVNLLINKFNPIRMSESDVTDKMLSGNYIISSINHVIDRERHECTMELIKDTIQLNPDKGDES